MEGDNPLWHFAAAVWRYPHTTANHTTAMGFCKDALTIGNSPTTSQIPQFDAVGDGGCQEQIISKLTMGDKRCALDKSVQNESKGSALQLFERNHSPSTQNFLFKKKRKEKEEV